jgi:hypothetical protein
MHKKFCGRCSSRSYNRPRLDTFRAGGVFCIKLIVQKKTITGFPSGYGLRDSRLSFPKKTPRPYLGRRRLTSTETPLYYIYQVGIGVCSHCADISINLKALLTRALLRWVMQDSNLQLSRCKRDVLPLN